MKQKIVAMIPARYAATRFPAKLMQLLGDKPVIIHTYLAVQDSGLFDEVYVVTDSTIIFDEVVSKGGKAIMSTGIHESGTDRIAEAAKDLDIDIIVNVQGDEPFIQAAPLKALVDLFLQEKVQVASLKRKFEQAADAANPNAVKVVTSDSGRALYFSRSAIPFNRDGDAVVDYYLHVGVYAFRKEALMRFTTMPQSHLETTEKLEQLRFLSNDVDIYMATTDYRNIAIDTPEDLAAAALLLNTE